MHCSQRRAIGASFIALSLAAGASLGRASAPPLLASPPRGADIPLRDGRFVHAVPLPFGDFEGSIVGDARFDASGTRALFVAVFAGIAPDGQPPPVAARQAFLFDSAMLRLMQLTSDGRATDVRWTGDTADILDNGSWSSTHLDHLGARPAGLIHGARILAPRSPLVGSGYQVSTERFGRFRVERVGSAYTIEQYGARRFRVAGVAPAGAFAFVGPFVVYVDGERRATVRFSRVGPAVGRPWSFAGSRYGDALVPIRPLGQVAVQGAYHRGTAYFPIRSGVDRGIAQTTDFVHYALPQVPDFRYSSGDGLGAGDDGAPYFARPESDDLAYFAGSSYTRVRLRVPDGARDLRRLTTAMRAIDPGNSLYPPLRAEDDALDTALSQWRFYPATPHTGERWIASHLGTLWSVNAAGAFSAVSAPSTAFTLLGRTDDGRLWGAALLLRRSVGPTLVDSATTLWSSNDGRRWQRVAALDSDAGAVGLDGLSLLVASTKPWLGRPMIWVTKIDPSGKVTASAPTGAAFGGEQLFFSTFATGTYLVAGIAPGFRLGGEQGALCAYRIDESALFGDAGESNAFAHQRLAPDDDPSLSTTEEIYGDMVALARPSIDAIYALPNAPHVQFVTNVALSGIDPKRVTLVTPARETAFEVKYAEVPLPVAQAVVDGVSGDAAHVHRSMRTGLTAGVVSDETWRRDAAGVWRLVSARLENY